MKTSSQSKHLNQPLNKRKVLLGVAASISAYKSCDLLRRLLDIDCDVFVIPTRSSLNFVGSATWEALSGNPVQVDLWAQNGHSPHVELARGASTLIIAPATANIIAKCAAGIADDLLTNTFLTMQAPVIFVPAMHSQMWLSDSNQSNVHTLRSRGFIVLEPESGALTSGDVGVGRYPEVSTIVDQCEAILKKSEKLAGKKLVITSGGTREAIDPVRYIGNRSSGKQGFELAKSALAHGAEVVLITTTPVQLHSPHLTIVNVESAAQMFEATKDQSDVDAYLFAAAVADARPVTISDEKIHKDGLSEIVLTENVDIAASIGAVKPSHVKSLIFAAETGESGVESAHAKLLRKNGDLIFMNRVDGGAIFNSPDSAGVLISPNGDREVIAPTSKAKIANLLIERLFGIV
jgi:phosphopantothenoylcysteine decarboxylase/phosphopantothenate--cysteine ligase